MSHAYRNSRGAYTGRATVENAIKAPPQNARPTDMSGSSVGPATWPVHPLWQRGADVKLADLPLRLVTEMEGPVPETEFESNGLTGAPDFISGADCRPAGHFHDYMYTIGGDETDRERADYAFYRNLCRCGLPRWMAGFEFRRVRLFGIRHFRYDDPPRGWARFLLYVSCFFSRYWRW